MEINEEWIQDNVEAGNYNTIFPLLNLSIHNNKSLTADEQKRLLKHSQRFQSALISKTFYPTFKERKQ